ncbi:MAG: response regulator, partial [Gramella sp.]|nr:response regulator [Christiangramia sp.]
LNQYKKDLLISEKEQKYQHEIIQKSKEKVVVMVFSSVGMIFILVFLYKVNRDRQRLIEKLKVKNLQYRDAKVDAERLSSLKTKFFSTVSHEIRTPLYGVIGLTSLLLEDKSLHKHKGDLKSLKFSADYLLALINDVLQMNKMESNEVKLENVPFSLQDLMKSIVNSFEFTRVQNKNTIILDIDPEIPANLIGDSVRLSQILMNLVGNAIKFTERGNIHIKAKQVRKDEEKSAIYFEIKDDGPGIPDSKKKMIFEEFSQLENSNYNYQGTGLGLPIVKRLLKLFNSKIKLESKEGEGSAFSFTISFKVDSSNILDTTKKEELLIPVNSGNRRILIVDDNRINQVVTKRILEKKDFECEVAGDGTTAIQMVRENHFDLILMDVNMPGISGLDASKEIRKFNDNIPILALTAVEVEEIREEIKTAGMSDIIIKPYDVQQFYQIVFKNLSISRLIEKV